MKRLPYKLRERYGTTLWTTTARFRYEADAQLFRKALKKALDSDGGWKFKITGKGDAQDKAYNKAINQGGGK